MTAEQIRLATDDDPLDISALVPVAPVDRDEMMDEVVELLFALDGKRVYKHD